MITSSAREQPTESDYKNDDECEHDPKTSFVHVLSGAVRVIVIV